MRLSGLMCFFMLLVTVAATAAETEVDTSPAMPVAQAEEVEYKFPTALDGDEIRHGFVIRNTGNAPLKIENVKTG